MAMNLMLLVVIREAKFVVSQRRVPRVLLDVARIVLTFLQTQEQHVLMISYDLPQIDPIATLKVRKANITTWRIVPTHWTLRWPPSSDPKAFLD
mgnify:CR=1 FL=1|jgi:hypothetical protein